METRRLYRSAKDRMLGGVCGGLGKYLAIDPILVRVFFLVMMFVNGIGVLVYLILWLSMPRERQPSQEQAGIPSSAGEFSERAKALGQEMGQAFSRPHPQTGIVIGVALVILGGFLFLDQLNLVWLEWFRLELLWPGLLTLAGLFLLLRRVRGE